MFHWFLLFFGILLRNQYVFDFLLFLFVTISRFYTSQFQEAVLESVPVGYNIVRVQAYDADEGSNAEISYSILDRKDSLPLAVDSRTGWIHTVKALDREDLSRYTFQVVATDGGVPPRSASSSVVITIQDVNDNDPTFSPSYYEASV